MTATTASGIATALAGELIGPGHPGYDRARQLYDGTCDMRPLLIARCTCPSDVQAALAHARAHNLIIAVRGGGHSGYGSCEGGVVIDTGPMEHADIDARAGIGRFGAGLTWGELDAATQRHGLAVTGGRVTHTGIAGLTLGSGSGWLERKYGMTCQSLISAQVVTADGRLLRASAGENADLLWGLKGAGGNFGVVTEFEFRLHRVGPVIFAGMMLYPRSDARELARFYRDFMAQAPDEVGGGLALITAPPEQFVPEHARGKPACGLILTYAGDPRRGEQVLRPLTEWGKPWVKMVQPMPYVAVQQLLDPSHPWGISVYAKVAYLRELPDEAIAAAVDMAGQASSPFTEVILIPLGGAVSRMDRTSMALGIPDARWFYFCLPMWWDPAGKDQHVAWGRAFMRALRPWSVRPAPPNFIAGDEGARLQASYGADKYQRLVALKDKFDPGNVFSLNANIPPSGAAAGKG
jgi:FAD/FMN-containing dehydrogenase